MHNVREARSHISALFSNFEYLSICILAGYPNYAINKPVEGTIKFAENDLIYLLHSENFDDDYILVKIINRLIADLQVIRNIDLEMSYWVLKKAEVTPDKLFIQCRDKIHCGILDYMINKGTVFPNWLNDLDYQSFLEKVTPFIERSIVHFENFLEEATLALNKIGHDQAIFLLEEWELRQNAKFIRWMIQEGIRNAFPEIIQSRQAEKNPLGWMVEGFSQRIKDKIDESMAVSPERAIKLLKQAFRLKPKSIQTCELYNSLAMNYEEVENWGEAINAYTHMLEAAPPNAVGLFNRAKLYHKLGRDAEAKKDLEDALTLPTLHIYLLSKEDRQEAQSLLNDISEYR